MLLLTDTFGCGRHRKLQKKSIYLTERCSGSTHHSQYNELTMVCQSVKEPLLSGNESRGSS